MQCNASSILGRRAFLKLSGLAALGSGLGPRVDTLGADVDSTHVLRIRLSEVELTPGRTICTVTYDGRLPGPLLPATVGEPVRVDVWNETDRPERIHWQGQDIGGDTCCVPARGLRRMQFVPTSPGLFCYHSAEVAATRLQAGLYSGQVGALLVRPRVAQARYAERVVILKDCEPFIRRTRRGCEIGYAALTLNGRLQGSPECAMTDVGAPMLVHLLNASATESFILTLPGHSFEVLRLDGRALPAAVRLEELHLHPGERIAALLQLHRPANWVIRNDAGVMDYTVFGTGRPQPVDAILELVLARHEAARSGFNRWSINGQMFCASNARPLLKLRSGLRYRLRIHNTSDEALPLHLQGHQLEIASVDGHPAAGAIRDVIAVGAQQRMEVDFWANGRGPALLHCTRQLHKDFGLMALVDYT